jgi:hypothetical protein
MDAVLIYAEWATGSADASCFIHVFSKALRQLRNHFRLHNVEKDFAQGCDRSFYFSALALVAFKPQGRLHLPRHDMV